MPARAAFVQQACAWGTYHLSGSSMNAMVRWAPQRPLRVPSMPGQCMQSKAHHWLLHRQLRIPNEFWPMTSAACRAAQLWQH